MHRSELLNLIARRIGAKTYLEIGVYSGASFNAVEVQHKVGVDPAPGSVATIYQESDRYFEDLAPDVRFDLVFVDGLHTREQAGRDIQNALAHLAPGGVVVVHDCDPPTEASAGQAEVPGIWCGEVWRAWVHFRATHPLGRTAFVVDTNLGCGVIGGPWPGQDGPVPLPEDADESFDQLRANRAAWLNLVSVDGFTALIQPGP